MCVVAELGLLGLDLPFVIAEMIDALTFDLRADLRNGGIGTLGSRTRCLPD